MILSSGHESMFCTTLKKYNHWIYGSGVESNWLCAGVFMVGHFLVSTFNDFALANLDVLTRTTETAMVNVMVG